MDSNEQIIKSQLERNRTATNGNLPSDTNVSKESAMSINDLLATGQHTNTGSFQAESGQSPQPSKTPPEGSNQTKSEKTLDGSFQTDPANDAFKGNTGGTTAGALIGGDLAVDLMDMALPAIFVFVVVKIGYKMDKKDLQLTVKEKATLAPAMQAVLDRMMIDLNNPYANLAMIMVIIYGSKVMALAPDMERLKPKKTEVEQVIDETNRVAESVEAVQQDAELSNQEKYEAELKILLRSHQKRSKKTYAVITKMFERDGTLSNLRKKYNL